MENNKMVDEAFEKMSLTSMASHLLNDDELENFVQELHYQNFKKEDGLKLLELNNDLLSAIEEGQTLYFKGDLKEALTLCTDSKTYSLKDAQTSNSLVLYDTLTFSKEVPKVDGKSSPKKRHGIGIFYSYLEPQQCHPKLRKLTSILRDSMYNGEEYERNVEETQLYDWEKLRSHVQASDQELKNALPEFLIAEIKGFYRLISFDYEANILTKILDFTEENSWEMDQVNKEETFEALSELVIRPVFDIIFDKYAKINDDNNLYSLDEAKVCKCLAKILLSASPSTEYVDFMEAWKMAVSEKMTPKVEYLYGLAVITQNQDLGTKEVIAYPEEKLPDDITSRIDELFSVKKKWTYEEITPYLSNLECTEESVTTLLATYCRTSTVDGVKYYYAKYHTR